MPSVCVCGDHFNGDHAMICKRGGFVNQRHNELRDLEAEMLRTVCNGVRKLNQSYKTLQGKS